MIRSIRREIEEADQDAIRKMEVKPDNLVLLAVLGMNLSTIYTASDERTNTTAMHFARVFSVTIVSVETETGDLEIGVNTFIEPAFAY